MEQWSGWPVERFIYLFLAAGFLLVWMQLTLYHWRGAFRSSFMWGPVLYTPVMIVTAILLGAVRGDVVETAFVVAFALGVVEGLAGVVLHARGIAAYVGGLSLRNLMAGPPVILPTIYAALSGFGLIVYYWGQITDAA